MWHPVGTFNPTGPQTVQIPDEVPVWKEVASWRKAETDSCSITTGIYCPQLVKMRNYTSVYGAFYFHDFDRKYYYTFLSNL